MRDFGPVDSRTRVKKWEYPHRGLARILTVQTDSRILKNTLSNNPAPPVAMRKFSLRFIRKHFYQGGVVKWVKVEAWTWLKSSARVRRGYCRIFPRLSSAPFILLDHILPALVSRPLASP